MFTQAQPSSATEPEVVQTGIAIVDVEPELEAPAVTGANIPATSPGGFQFMSASELESGDEGTVLAPDADAQVVITETLEDTGDGVVITETLELVPAVGQLASSRYHN
jgi:hypothetical protein